MSPQVLINPPVALWRSLGGSHALHDAYPAISSSIIYFEEDYDLSEQMGLNRAFTPLASKS